MEQMRRVPRVVEVVLLRALLLEVPMVLAKMEERPRPEAVMVEMEETVDSLLAQAKMESPLEEVVVERKGLDSFLPIKVATVQTVVLYLPIHHALDLLFPCHLVHLLFVLEEALC